MMRHHEIDDWLEISQDILDKYEFSLGTSIDDDLAKAVIDGRMTPEEADECRTDYLDEQS